ncbi:MAG: hypothetical protein H6822_15185 [Planctomycetaceae bacterium]|nr:hypothetical protein [Planctomycetales bacterium]MCB9923525.1 hypothetical protein [Planctomycetaceae bacterium]
MSNLQAFRAKLRRLRNQRTLTRWHAVVARGAILVVPWWFALLLIDFVFRLEAGPRVIAMLAVGGVVAWRAFRTLLPELAVRESLVDVALELERVRGVGSDLVAALQFDAPSPNENGSFELRQAVIDHVADVSETINMRSVVPSIYSYRCTWLALGAITAVIGFHLIFASHAAAFWNRLCLGNATYPTRTIITEFSINGRADVSRVIEGDLVTVAVKCVGIMPMHGTVKLYNLDTGESTRMVLERVESSGNSGLYEATGPQLYEPVECSVSIGDAILESRLIEIVRRPLVELTIESVAPAYMHFGDRSQQVNFAQVMEGSAIAFSVRCTNGKRLREVFLERFAQGADAGDSISNKFSETDRSSPTWRLDAAASDLQRVVRDFQFRVHVADEDGLSPYHPIEGAIRVKRDHGPTATIASQHQSILPNATPTISYAVEDDFGVGEVKLRLRRSGSREAIPAVVPGQDDRASAELPYEFEEVLEVELQPFDTQVASLPKSAVGNYRLDVSQFDLAKGDKLVVWIEATDDRGDWPGLSATSESIELDVSDERGVLDVILRSDADAEHLLTEMIEQELGLQGGRQ